MSISSQFTQLKHRVEYAIQQFSTGKPILIGDDGKRENEVDFVFHASFSSKEIVNLAITQAKGLLCVALDHSIADKLGFYTAPRFPGGISHTNFTLSVDAKSNITSGISAQDRAHTIQLMASPHATASDFITPGHVFPLRAVEGGLLARAGHTEAIFELCQFSNLPCAGAICEVLDENGDPISPHDIQQGHAFSALPFITTIDLLWYKILYKNANQNSFRLSTEKDKFISGLTDEEFVSLPCAVQFYSQRFDPTQLRIVLNNGFSNVDNGISQQNCFAEIVLFNYENLLEELPEDITQFCDLSAKIGLQSTKTSVKRFVTLLKALHFVAQKTECKITAEQIDKMSFPVHNDRKQLRHAFMVK